MNIDIKVEMLVDEYGPRAENYALDELHKSMEKDDIKVATTWFEIFCRISDLKEKIARILH